MKFISPNLKKPKLVFIDGITRSGKSLLTNILPTFRNFEHIDIAYELEILMQNYYCNKITLDALRVSSQKSLYEKAYNKLLSRSLNLRNKDQTGLNNYPFKKIYLQRLKKKEGDDIISELNKSKNYFPFQTHDLMFHKKGLLNLGLNFKIIEIYRNPFDLIYSWIGKDIENRLATDQRMWVYPTLKFKNNFVGAWYHLFVKKYFNIWNKVNKYERTSLMVSEMIKNSIKNQKHLEKNISILTLSYEEIIYDKNLIKKLEKFLGTKKSKFTELYLKKSRIPRKSIKQNQNRIKNLIKNKIDKKTFDVLDKLEMKYKRNTYGFENII